jgi:hypothetical protein
MRRGYLQQIGGQGKSVGFSLDEDQSLEDSNPSINSIRSKILRLSPCASRFCSDQITVLKHKPFKMNILRKATENDRTSRADCKSLFWNILRVKSLESRICGDKTRSRQCKPFEMKILAGAIEKRIYRGVKNGWRAEKA